MLRFRVAMIYPTTLPIAAALIAMAFASLTSALAAETAPIRFGILSTAQPARIHEQWGPFVAYISERVGQPIEIVIPRGFEKMKEAAINGEVDVFYVNSHVYYRLRQAGAAQALTQMQNIAGKTTSRSEFFVRGDSGIDGLAQLRGKNVVMVSPMGAGGYLAPRAFLYKNGITTQDVTESFSKNLSSSLHQVLTKEAPVGVMCGVNYRLLQEKLDTRELKIIAVTDDYAEDVIAIRAGFDEGMGKRLRDTVLEMSENDVGRSVLSGMHELKIQQFLPYDSAAEAITRKLLAEAQLEP